MRCTPDVESSAPGCDDASAAGAGAAAAAPPELDGPTSGALPDVLLLVLAEMSLNSTLATLLFVRLSASLAFVGNELLFCSSKCVSGVRLQWKHGLQSLSQMSVHGKHECFYASGQCSWGLACLHLDQSIASRQPLPAGICLTMAWTRS